MSLEKDPDIIAAQKKSGYDLDVLHNQFATAQVRENVLTTWYADWDRFTAVRARLDPDGRFANAWTERVLGPARPVHSAQLVDG